MNSTEQHTRSHNPLLPLVLDVGIPLGSYYLMQHLGFSLMVSLAVSGLLPGVRVVWGAVRNRKVDGLAMAVLALTVISIPLAFIAGSPKLMLAKEAIGTGPLGIWLIVSARIGRPAMTDGVRPFLARGEGSSAAWEQLIVESARFRACLNAITTVWGIGFVVECVARVALVCLLPVHTVVWANNIPVFAVIIGCILVQSIWAGQLDGMIKARVKENDRHAEETRPALLAA